MGKAARFACIILPMLATLVSLFCGLSILAAGTNKSINGLDILYHFKVDTRDINIGGKKLKDLKMADFYSSYMWNYCSGTIKNGEWDTTECEKTKTGYTFDIEAIIDEKVGNNNTVNLPDNVRKVQKAVNTVSKFMTACYVLGFAATVVTFFVGWFGLLSRWGSCVTTIFADVAFLFLLIASCCSTALAYSLKGAFNKALDEWGVRVIIGSKFMSTTWTGVLFAFAACLFWTMSMCCCSGRTRSVMDNKQKKRGSGLKSEFASGTGAGYQRVASPYMGGSTHNVPMQPYGQPQRPGMEPMRHV